MKKKHKSSNCTPIHLNEDWIPAITVYYKRRTIQNYPSSYSMNYVFLSFINPSTKFCNV